MNLKKEQRSIKMILMYFNYKDLQIILIKELSALFLAFKNPRKNIRTICLYDREL